MKTNEVRNSARHSGENSPHGGSWVDNFADEMGIDWTKTDNIWINESNVKVNVTDYIDNYCAGYWKFDEGSGITTYDETPNNNHGTLGGDGVGSDIPTWTTGIYGTGLNYDGVNDYVDCGTGSSLDMSTNDFSVTLWARFLTTGNRVELVNKRAQITGTFVGYQCQRYEDNTFRIIIDDGQSGTFKSTTPLTDSNWHHIAYVVDRDTEANCLIYLDGVPQTMGNSFQAGFAATQGSMSNTQPFLIGWNNYPSNQVRMNGDIDEVMVYRAILSALEVKDIYENGTYKFVPRSYANLTSTLISLPQDKKWDTFIINKTQPMNTYLNVTILNGSDDQPIPGSITYTDDGEFDISYIDPVKYPTIKLNATLITDKITSPTLHYWGISWVEINTWRDTFFGGLKGTYGDLTASNGKLQLKIKPTDWERSSFNPIVQNGPSGTWDDYGVGRPCVIYDGNEYKMWFEGRPSGLDWDIGLATSPFGITWTKYSNNPVLTRGNSGEWDDYCVGSPCVIFDGTTYKMWYMGRRGSVGWRIGYATSTNGINWQKHSSNPVLIPSGSTSWEGDHLVHPMVCFDGSIYRMWYSAQDSSGTYRIGYASSSNGISWQKYGNNPIIMSTSGNGYGTSGISVIKKQNSFFGWYTNKTGAYPEITYATSTDGVNWIVDPNNPVFQKSNSGWDSDHIALCDVKIFDDRYYMYYEGQDNGPPMQIGLAQSNYKNKDVLTSNTINIPHDFYWDKLIINKSEPSVSTIQIEILDANTNQIIPGFNNLAGNNINLLFINPHKYDTIKLRATFDTAGYTSPILNDWSINWTRNKPPYILDLDSTNNTVYRTDTTQIYCNVTDCEDTAENITIGVCYKSPGAPNWQNNYLSNLHFVNGSWILNFTPSKNAILGLYTFNVSCNDSFNELDIMIFNDVIEVLNNPPGPPDVEIYPLNPTTQDNLLVIAWNVSDLENEPITFKFEWYINDVYQPGLTTELVPYSFTNRNEVWKCIVTPNDGNEDGQSAEVEVIIINSAPEVDMPLLQLIMHEDSIDYSTDLNKIFKDADNDILEFDHSGNNYIDVNIFDNGTVKLEPEPDWFGSETITFYANDSINEIYDSLFVKVLPVNDEPVLEEIASLDVRYMPSDTIIIKTDEDEWLHLTIIAYDIDGDRLSYDSNRTDNIDNDDLNYVFFNENILSILPTNDDVGILFINISVSDNNGSIIYQNLEINIDNVNDPPSVRITNPSDGMTFLSTDSINFSCEWSDDDLKIPNSNEELTFTWKSNITQTILGHEDTLTNISLIAGFHQITIEVEDSGHIKVVDIINITVVEPPIKKPSDSILSSENYWWLIIVIVIIIILVIFAVLFIRKKKAREKAAQLALSSTALTPELVPQPAGEPLPAVTTIQPSYQLTPTLGPVPTPQIATATTTAPQLPVVEPTTRSYLPPAPSEVEQKERSKEDRIKLLDEQLLKGEITNEQYELQKSLLETKPVEEQPQAQMVGSTSVVEPVQPQLQSAESVPSVESSQPQVTAPEAKPIVQPKIIPTIKQADAEPSPQIESLSSGIQVTPDSQPQPSPELQSPEHLQVVQPQIYCPNCQRYEVTIFPDNSYACNSCGNKWI